MKDSVFYLKPKKQRGYREERHILQEELKETCRALEVARIGFNMADDPNLVEFYLYETNALWARHTYLLRRIKSLDSPKPTAIEERGEM